MSSRTLLELILEPHRFEDADRKKTKVTTVSEIVPMKILGLSCGAWSCIFSLIYFPILFWAMCTYIKDDPAAILIDGQPMPQLWTNITTVAFLTSLTLDLFTWAWTTEPSKAAMFAFPLAVGTCSFISYLGLAMGYCPLLASFDGRRFIPSRYLKWCVTTPLMLTTYAVLSELSLSEFVICIASDLLMLVLGGMASYCVSPHNYVYLALSFMFYFPVIYYINKMLELAIESYSVEQKEMRQAFNSARIVMLIGWVTMPTIWIFSWLNLMDPAAEEIGYEIVDFLTKCGCSSMLMHSSLRTQADREAERSREALVVERGRMVDVLQQTTLQREKFFAALSAQLRSPLVCMAGLIQELMNDAGEPSAEEQISQLNAFVTAGTHLVFTIDDMLALSQKKQKERSVLLPVTMWETDVPEMLSEIVRLVRGMSRQDLDYNVTAAEELPKVRVDVRRAHQALHNVLSFMAHCAAEQGTTSGVEVSCKASRDRSSVMIQMEVPGAKLGHTPEVRKVIQNRFVDRESTLVPETFAAQSLWNASVDQPEDAARDESLQCLLIAKDLLTQTGGTCTVPDPDDDACSLVVTFPAARSRTSFGGGVSAF
mmetsp:Transcript_39673/g.93990  ORF Transcript_39673/g.93990 Transcript_39673/m.93990 type:complete len:597 (+) Transcript_39673:142-1932(+)